MLFSENHEEGDRYPIDHPLPLVTVQEIEGPGTCFAGLTIIGSPRSW
jgi:hypothetical protein